MAVRDKAILAVALAVAVLLGAPVPGWAAGAGAGAPCGGPHRITCDGGLWCEPAPGHCGQRHAAGACVKASPMCTRIWRPVCGCNGKTYGNDCERRSHRVPKKAVGSC